MSFAIAFPVLAGAVGVGLDYAGAASMRSKMQGVAHGAALHAAHEFQTVQASIEKVRGPQSWHRAAQSGDR